MNGWLASVVLAAIGMLVVLAVGPLAADSTRIQRVLIVFGIACALPLFARFVLAAVVG